MPDRATESDLQKAQIHVLDGGDDSNPIPVLFNPTEYSLSKSVQYGDQQLAGRTTPVTQFVSGDAETLSMELFFDTYAKGTDVRAHTDQIDGLLSASGDRTAPPRCRFVWGSLVFTAVLQSADKRFTMFLSDGVPVRARVDVTFREYSTPSEESSGGGEESADKTKVRVVKEGDTLWQIAKEEYGDPYEWRRIAEENGIENPRRLQIGTELVIPPLES